MKSLFVKDIKAGEKIITASRRFGCRLQASGIRQRKH